MIRSQTGASAELVRRALRDEISIGMSVALALEYEAVATRPEHLAASGLETSEAMRIIDSLIGVASPVAQHFRWRPLLRDADDEMVLETAVNGGASAIVTFNAKDFRAGARKFGIDVMLPKEALETLR